MTTIGNLYSKNIMVRLTNSKSEDKYKLIHISIDYQTSIQPTHKTELIVKLTDEQDPFFLYSLFMGEEDYQTLKVQQSLLVDFNAFGQRFIDLLCACEKDEKSDRPKFQLQFYSKEPLPFDHGHASLNIIEINPFKHLCHLSLNFSPGNDADVKKYLANCLQSLREDFSKLTRLHDETKSSLTQKLDNSQQALAQKCMEFDKLKLELESQSERIMAKHMQEINFERDKSLQNQYAAQQKWDKEKKDMELNHMKSMKNLESRLNELELNNKELIEKKYKNESQLQEMRIKNNQLQEEYNLAKKELNDLRKQNTTMDSEIHSNEKLVNQMRTRLAVQEQELKDKIDTLNKTQDLLAQEQSQRKQIDEILKEKNAELRKKQSEINHYVQEFKKGNEVVIKLQTREKSLVGQVKLKTRILNEQEKVMKEKEKEIDDLKLELKELKSQTNSLNDEIRDLKATLQKKSVELEEAAKLLKRDENIISWLNKQITESNLASTGKMVSYESHANTGNLMANSLASFKPYGSLMPNLNTPLGSIEDTLRSTTNGTTATNTAVSGFNHSTLQFLNKSTSNDLDSTSNRRALLQNNSQTQFYQNGLNGGSGGGGGYQQRTALSSSSSSSIPQTDLLKENQETGSPTLAHSGLGNSNNQTSSSSRLDPKYFQSHASSLATTSVESIKQQQQQLGKSNGILASNSTVRINKQLVQGNTGLTSQLLHQQHQQQQQQQQNGSSSNNGLIPSKSTPSLASAYFPSN